MTPSNPMYIPETGPAATVGFFVVQAVEPGGATRRGAEPTLQAVRQNSTRADEPDEPERWDGMG